MEGKTQGSQIKMESIVIEYYYHMITMNENVN